ncbi:adenosine receptor A2b-like isoform X2 [Apostichopus japonicus]
MAKTRPILHVPAYTLCAASVNHLVVISSDRYLAVTKVLKYQSILTSRRCYFLIAIAWSVAILFGLTPVLGSMKNPADLSICDGHRYKAKSVTLHSLAIIALIPTILIIVVGIYVRVLLVALKASHLRTNISNASSNSTPSEREVTARLRATITMAMVLGAFIFCWLPTVFKHIYEIKHWYDFDIMFAVRTIVEIMAYLNSMINPIIYGYRNHLFRKSYKKLLNQVCRRTSGKLFNGHMRSLTIRLQLTSSTSVDLEGGDHSQP